MHSHSRHLWLTLVSLALLTLACGTPQRPTPESSPERPIRLTILSINDFHGQIDARPKRTGETPPRSLLIGGAEALAATIADLRAQNPKGTLLLDGGDFMQGSMVSNHFEGTPIRELYSLMGVDATVVGNHEFDFGPVGPSTVVRSEEDKPRGALRAWIRKAPFPVLSANLRDKAGKPLLWENLRSHVIIERAGLRIGIVGLTTTHTPTTTLRANVSDLRFEALRQSALREARALGKAKVDLRILLAHAGGTCASEDPTSCRGEIFDLVRSLPPKTFDLVVSAHSHRCLRHEIAGTPVVQACALGIAVGRVDLLVEKRAKGSAWRSTHKIYLPHPVCHQVFAKGGSCEIGLRHGAQHGRLLPNPALTRHAGLVQRISQALAPFRERTRPLEQKILAHFARPLKHPFAGGSEVAYLFAKMMKAAVPGADIALVNAGGIRGSIPAGPLRYGDLYRVFPFDNRLATLRVSGAELEKLLRASLTQRHRGVMQAAGLSAQVHCDSSGQRRLSTLKDAQGRPLLNTRVYKVVLADFLLSGGDGLSQVMDKIPTTRKKVLVGRLIRNEMATYLLAHKGLMNLPRAPVLTKDNPSIRPVGEGCAPPKRPKRAICR
ncbi:MAG: bifunctional metallophosphatase/5'-nucleotidase [Deltaproteobacteria bacterium]|nr:bifunctional metallophosphatase/5'-nucleotidase [Deltaproteobacteria bacterium]